MSQNEVVSKKHEALREFYEQALINIHLPELLYVNAVSSARAACRDKLESVIDDVNPDNITIDWRESTLSVFHKNVSKKLLSGDSFLRTAPSIREAVRETAAALGDYAPKTSIQDAVSFQISLLEIKPGDVLLIRIKEHFSVAAQAEICEELKSAFDNALPGVKSVTIFGDAEFIAIRKLPETNGGEK